MSTTAIDNPGLGELHFIRHQLDWLGEQRSSVCFSSAEQVEYQRLIVRETELLRLVR